MCYTMSQNTPNREDGSTKFYIALSRIYVRSPFVIVENDWYLSFSSHAEAIKGIIEISLKQPVDINSMERFIVRTPSRLYKAIKFSGIPQYNITDMKITGELVEWISYREILGEVYTLVSELFNTEPKNKGIIRSAVVSPITKYDVLRVVYRDKYEMYGEIWLIRRFKRETMERNLYLGFKVGRKSFHY